ncbi:MAG: hypothetical protein AB4911_13735 [Oscillochloridaceae bacterium umkhey_bin13]
MHTDDPLPPPNATATPEPRRIPVRRAMPCCVRQAQRTTADPTAYLRAAAVWAALLRPSQPTEDLAIKDEQA